MFKKHNCHFCDEQFLANERRWRIYTLPVFSLMAALTMTEHPIKLWSFLVDLIYLSTIIFLLWVANRYLIVKFHNKYWKDRSKKKKLILRYIVSIVISLGIVVPAIKIYHIFCVSDMYPKYTYDYKETHRMLYMITVLFVYFINANYERLFLFMELSHKAVEAEKYKKDSIEASFKNLKNKINPHFLFNTFNALSEIIDEDPPKATKMVQEMSDVYRYVLDNQENNWVSLKKEVDFAHSYVSLLKMRFEERLIVSINIDETKLNAFITPLTMQILLENVVKHNQISSKQSLNLNIYLENDWLIVENTLQPKETFGNGTSFGLANLTERYKFLSGRQVVIQKTESDFTVKIPLIERI